MGHNGIIASAFRISSGGVGEDTVPPVIGTLNNATLICQTYFTISWTAAVDNIGVAGYRLYKGGVLYQDVGNVLTHTVTGQVAGESATWYVRAYDAALNESSNSNGVVVTQSQKMWQILLGFGEAQNRAEACGQLIDVPYYRNTNLALASGQQLYLDDCSWSVVNGGDQYWSNGVVSFQVDIFGYISNLVSC